MTNATYSSELLVRLAEGAHTATTVPIDVSYLPVGPLTILHALAVSHGTLLVAGHGARNRRQLNLVTSTFLDLTLLFGSSIVTSALLAQPSPILRAPETVAVYASVHAISVLSGLGGVLVSLSGVTGVGIIVDVLFAIADAFCRSDGIAELGIESVRSHADPLLASSTYAALTIGTIVGAGGFLLIGMLSLDSDEWTLRTPTWLSTPSLLLTIDLISSFLAAALYHYTTVARGAEQLHLLISNPAILAVSQPYLQFMSARTAQLLQVKGKPGWGSQKGPLLGQDEAKALSALLLFSLSLGTRLNRGLWASLPSPQQPVRASRTGASAHTGAELTNGEEKLPARDAKAVRKRKSTVKVQL